MSQPRLRLDINADNVIRLRGMVKSTDGTAVTTGFAATAKVTTEADEATALITTSSWTYVAAQDWWYAVLAKPETPLTEDALYRVIVTGTAPGDSYENWPAVAKVRGKA